VFFRGAMPLAAGWPRSQKKLIDEAEWHYQKVALSIGSCQSWIVQRSFVWDFVINLSKYCVIC
jgi:hypothetical protein